MYNVIYFFFCSRLKHSSEKKYIPKSMNNVKTSNEYWCHYFQRRLRLYIWAAFFFSFHALLLLYHMQFYFHIFVCLYSFTSHQHNGFQKHLARLLKWHLMLLFIYSFHLSIYSSSLTVRLDYLLFFSYAISVRFTVAFPSDGMHCCLTYRVTEVTSGVLQGQSAIYIKEQTAGIGFHCLTGDSRVGDVLPYPLKVLLGPVHACPWREK